MASIWNPGTPIGTGYLLEADVADVADVAKGAALIGFSPTLNYVGRTLGYAERSGIIKVEWFRYDSSGVARTDRDTILNALAAAQLTLSALKFADRTYTWDTTITLSGSPVAFIGEETAPLQQGSVRPATVLKWNGGAAPMFEMTSGSAWAFIGMGIENAGSATDFLVNTNGSQHMLFRSLSFLIGSGSNVFSRSIFYSPTNGYGYSSWERCHCFGAAPKFIYIDGNGASNGVTPIFIGNRCVFESNSASPVTVVYAEDVNFDSIIIDGNTFNQQSATNELTILDTTASPRATVATNVVISNNEWDLSVGGATNTHRALRITNCRNVVITRTTISGGGSVTGWAALVNSTVQFDANYFEALAGPVFVADTLSRVYTGVNDSNAANTTGVINDAATGSGIVQLAFAATVTILGQLGAGPGYGITTYEVAVTGTGAWTLTFVHPGISSGGHFVRGQKIAVRLRNTSGGVMTAPTINTTYFKVAGGSFPVPANGTSRTVILEWNGSALIECSRTTSDVPN